MDTGDTVRCTRETVARSTLRTIGGSKSACSCVSTAARAIFTSAAVSSKNATSTDCAHTERHIHTQRHTETETDTDTQQTQQEGQ
jgi:hypothetical protein